MRDARRKRPTVAEFGPDPVDVHVGSRLRALRSLAGMSQTDIADALGLTFQQVQKNERGVNRMGSSRLYQLSLIFGVPVEYFFEGLEAPASAKRADDVMTKRETLELVRAYDRITNSEMRTALRDMVKAIAKLG